MRERKPWKEAQHERLREREKEKIIIKKSSNLLPSKMTLHCSKDVKNFKNNILDMDDILRGYELKLGFSICHIFNVNTLMFCKILILE